ncbi:alcohol dehydrogenase catalytic domain-containing protein [Anaerofustis butyriciformans]|uniref:alcohol dehydrogenase catalytic domain-containing protein n=1 Tax=Anaerofustis TaxID=264995 RepID=UPI003F8B2E2B
MEAVVFRGPNDFGLENVETPECPEGGILVKVEAVGLCGSDIRTFGSGHKDVTPPHILGHEVAGVIEKSDNAKYPAGKRVVLNPLIKLCGECYFCKNGLQNHCINKKLLGSEMPGGYAQYVPIPADCCTDDGIVEVPEGFNLDLIPLAETLSSVYSTQEFANVKDGDVVVVIGAGPLGNLHSAVAKARGAKKVIISEPSEHRLEMAHRFDTTDDFVNPIAGDLHDFVMQETDGIGADVVITACPVGSVQVEATHLLKPRGKVILFGGLPKDNCHVAFDSNLIHYQELVLYGGYAYAPSVFRKAIELITTGKIDATKFITHVIPLKEIKKGIELVKTGEAIKVVLKPWE